MSLHLCSPVCAVASRQSKAQHNLLDNFDESKYCDVHAVGLRSRHYLVTARHATMGCRNNGCSLWGPIPGYISKAGRHYELVILMCVALDREKPFIENTRG
jgi:hypothetical protein